MQLIRAQVKLASQYPKSIDIQILLGRDLLRIPSHITNNLLGTAIHIQSQSTLANLAAKECELMGISLFNRQNDFNIKKALDYRNTTTSYHIYFMSNIISN